MRIRKLATLAASVLATSVALAGTILVSPVGVTLNPDGSGLAWGSMVTARFSDKYLEFIGCMGGAVALGEHDHVRWGNCSARTGGGVMRSCYTEHPGLVEVIRSAADYSYISFRWNAEGFCESVTVDKKSGFIP